jgi:hypothetical protein
VSFGQDSAKQFATKNQRNRLKIAEISRSPYLALKNIENL